MIDPTAHCEVLRVLDEFEETISAQEQAAVRKRLISAANWETLDRPPVVIIPPWDSSAIKTYPICEAVQDPAKMLYNELHKGIASPYGWMAVGDDRPLQIRPDFGCGLVSSVFGAEVKVVGNNPAWVKHLSENDIEAAVERAIDKLDLSRLPELGWVPRYCETYEYYLAMLADYPNLKSSLAVTLPDMQGPFDNAAMMWGSSIFETLYTNPELVSRFCAAVADAMVALHDFFRRDYVGRELLPKGYSHQHGVIIRGNLLLRGDSNLMLSTKMYIEAMRPHDQDVLRRVGGGSYHSCGKWEHNVPAVMEMEEVGSLDFGVDQSFLNDIDSIYKAAAEGKKHLNLVTAMPEELASGSIIDRFPTGVTLSCIVDSTETAAELMEQYLKTAKNR